MTQSRTSAPSDRGLAPGLARETEVIDRRGVDAKPAQKSNKGHRDRTSTIAITG